ncbi:MAG: pentapeptide repeat-containing protein, partial [Cyanobacteria bacterium J083]
PIFNNTKVEGAIFSNTQGLSTAQKQWLKKNGALNIN